MKRKLHTLFAVLLTLSLLTATASAKSFPDVDTGAWYSDAVEYMNELGVMVGDTEGNFNPDKTVTRAEMAAVICRTLEKTLSEEEYLPVYERDLETFRMARRKLGPHFSPAGKIPAQVWQQELTALQQEYQAEYEKYKPIRDDLWKLQQVKRCTNTALHQQEQIQKKRREAGR